MHPFMLNSGNVFDLDSVITIGLISEEAKHLKPSWAYASVRLVERLEVFLTETEYHAVCSSLKTKSPEFNGVLIIMEREQAALLREAYDYGQYADDAQWQMPKSIRVILQQVAEQLPSKVKDCELKPKSQFNNVPGMGGGATTC